MTRRTQRGHRLNWRPDLPDARDHLFAQHAPVTAAVPDKVDLSDKSAPVVDQGDLGSCTSNALCAALGFLHGGPACIQPSRLFVYYGERVIEGDVKQDAGAEIRDGVKVLNKAGAPPETDWPYVVAKFARKPPKKAYADALKQTISSYLRIGSHAERLQCLADGFPFVAGATLYDAFEGDAVANTGAVNMPGKGEKVIGGHAFLVIGYDTATNRYLCQNSWGRQWGMGGRFTMPFAYLDDANLSDDHWTLRK